MTDENKTQQPNTDAVTVAEEILDEYIEAFLEMAK